MTKLALVTFLSSMAAACVPPSGYAPPPAYQQQQQQQQGATDPAPDPQPVVDNRNPAQVVYDILAQAGYACNQNESDLLCGPQGNGWQFFIWYENQSDGTIQVVFDSFIRRAFGRPCSEFANAIQDLRDDANGFSATCEDDIQKFRLRQRLVYNETLDVSAWAADHLQRRLTAGQQLRSIHALAKEDARALGR